MSGVPIVPHPISQRSSYKVDGLRQLPSIRPEIFDGFTAEVLHPHPDTHVRMLGDFLLIPTPCLRTLSPAERNPFPWLAARWERIL